MNHQACHDLAQTLAASGYSRRFIRRLIDELEDHAQCVVSESPECLSQQAKERLFLRRVGTSAELLSAIENTPSLESLPARRPFLFFLVLPATWLLIWVSLQSWLVQGLPTTVGQLGSWAPLACETAELAQQIVPVIAALMACGLAITRVALHWQVLGLGIVAMSSLLQVEVVYCAQSGSIASFPHWHLLPLQLAILLVALALAVRRQSLAAFA